MNKFPKVRKETARGFLSLPKYLSRINNPKNIRLLVPEGPILSSSF